MTKKIASVLLSFTLFFLFFDQLNNVSAAVDYSGGLLDGKTMSTGYDRNHPLSSTTAITDNDELTSWTSAQMDSGTIIQDVTLYSFTSPTYISGYRVKGTGNFTLLLLNSSDTILKQVNVDGSGTLVTFSPGVSGVAKVAMGNLDPNSNNIYEINVYGYEKPIAPLNLLATGGDTKVDLKWDLVVNATSYNIKRSTTPGGPYTVIATGVTGAVYMDTTVNNSTTYYYEVTAINLAGESTNSNEASATPQTSGRAILTITMTNGLEKEYDLSMVEVNAFINWYDVKDTGTGPGKYKFIKTWNKGPFKARSEYVIFDKILTFNVDEYDVVTP